MNHVLFTAASSSGNCKMFPVIKISGIMTDFFLVRAGPFSRMNRCYITLELLIDTFS